MSGEEETRKEQRVSKIEILVFDFLDLAKGYIAEFNRVDLALE